MANIKAINLDDDSLELWKKRFDGKRDFSSWIQQKMKEEIDELSDTYWINIINQNQTIIQDASARISVAKKKLEDLQKTTLKVENVQLSEEEIEKAKKERTADMLFSRGTTKLTQKQIDYLKSRFLNSDYTRLTFAKFLESEGYYYDDHNDLVQKKIEVSNEISKL